MNLENFYRIEALKYKLKRVDEVYLDDFLRKIRIKEKKIKSMQKTDKVDKILDIYNKNLKRKNGNYLFPEEATETISMFYNFLRSYAFSVSTSIYTFQLEKKENFLKLMMDNPTLDYADFEFSILGRILLNKQKEKLEVNGTTKFVELPQKMFVFLGKKESNSVDIEGERKIYKKEVDIILKDDGFIEFRGEFQVVKNMILALKKFEADFDFQILRLVKVSATEEDKSNPKVKFGTAEKKIDINQFKEKVKAKYSEIKGTVKGTKILEATLKCVEDGISNIEEEGNKHLQEVFKDTAQEAEKGKLLVDIEGSKFKFEITATGGLSFKGNPPEKIVSYLIQELKEFIT